MNPTLALLAVAALLAPAAAIGYTTLAHDPPRDAARSRAASGTNVEIVLDHKGDATDATLAIDAPGHHEKRGITLRGERQVVALALAPDEVAIRLVASTFSASSSGDLRACDEKGIRFTFETYRTDGATPIDGSSGVRVLGPDCVGAAATPRAAATNESSARADERFAGTQRIGLAANAPWPTCPTSCTVGYSFFGTSGLSLPVRVGATSIDVVARWSPTSPLTEKLHVGLFVEDAACGDGCWQGVAGEAGAREVRFTLHDPAPVKHLLDAYLDGPGAGADQDVEFEVVVHYS